MESKKKVQRKKSALSSGSFGITGFAAGFFAAVLFFGVSIFLEFKVSQKTFYVNLFKPEPKNALLTKLFKESKEAQVLFKEVLEEEIKKTAKPNPLYIKWSKMDVFELIHQVFETDEKEEFHNFLAIFFKKLDQLENKGNRKELIAKFLENFEAEEEKQKPKSPSVEPELVASKIDKIKSEENVVDIINSLQGVEDEESRNKLLNNLVSNFEDDQKVSNKKEIAQTDYEEKINNILRESEGVENQESLEKNIVSFYENMHSLKNRNSKQSFHKSMEDLFEIEEIIE